MLRKLFNIDTEQRETISKLYLDFILYPLGGIGILYLFFILVQIIDLFAELFTYDSKVFLFYYLRYFFSAVNFVMLIVLIYSVVILFNGPDDSPAIKIQLFSVLISTVNRILIIWTVCLLGTFIPRIILLLNYRETIGTFVTVLIYLKLFAMIPFYLFLIIIYVIAKEIRFSDIDNL